MDTKAKDGDAEQPTKTPKEEPALFDPSRSEFFFKKNLTWHSNFELSPQFPLSLLVF